MKHNNDYFQSKNVNKKKNVGKFNLVNIVVLDFFSSRVFYRQNARNVDWKMVENISLNKIVPLVNQENCKNQIFIESQGILDPHLTTLIILLMKLHQITLHSPRNSVKSQVIPSMILIVMKINQGLE